MNLKYRIISTDTQDHQIVIRYYTDLFSEEFLANMFNEDGSVMRHPDGYPLRCRTDYVFSMMHSKKPTKAEILKMVEIGATGPREFFNTLEATTFSNTYSLAVAEKMIGQTGDVPEPKK